MVAASNSEVHECDYCGYRELSALSAIDAADFFRLHALRFCPKCRTPMSKFVNGQVISTWTTAVAKIKVDTGPPSASCKIRNEW
jgi:predicted nucleic-acid-binding Zn-ribbon protein